MAAGAADVILDAPSLPAAGRKKGVMSKVVANACMGNFGWQLMVLTNSTLDVKDLNGKKVAITSAGSGSDLLALWTIQEKKIEFTRVPRRRRRPGAEPFGRQCRRRRGVLPAQLPDRQIRRGASHHRLRQRGAAEPYRGLDSPDKFCLGKARHGAEDAERPVWRTRLHARQQGHHRQADRRTLRDPRRTSPRWNTKTPS